MTEGWIEAISPLPHQPVPVVPLARFEAQVADEPAHLGNRQAKRRAGLADDILLDHDAAEVVGAKPKPKLAHGRPLGDPGALDVFKVV